MSLPASEIIREAEKQLIEAQQLRLSAYELLREASLLEDRTRNSTIEAMGPETGMLAFEMAKWSLAGMNGSNLDHVNATTTDVGIVQTDKNLTLKDVDVKSTVTPEPRSTVKVSEPKKVTVNPRNNIIDAAQYFGEKIPSDRVAEADDIISQASSYVSQGRKGNPYGSDRGKNAWRKSLFNAAYSHLAKNSEQRASANMESVYDGPLSDLDNNRNSDVSSVSYGQVNVNDAPDDELQKEIDDITDELVNETNSENDIVDVQSKYDIDDDIFLDEDVSENNEAFEEDYSYGNNYDGDIIITDFSTGETFYDTDEEVIIDINSVINPELDPSLDQTETVVPESSYVDPFDDIGDLPPANPNPPPRGFSSVQTESIISPVTNMRMSQPRKTTFISDGFAKPNTGVFKPSIDLAVSDKGVTELSTEKPVKSDPADDMASSTPMAHTPRPVPSSRRPGNGQVLQQPTTLPSALTSVKPIISDKPKNNSFSSPPSFMSRKA